MGLVALRASRAPSDDAPGEMRAAGLAAESERALRTAPRYWLAWYTVKSLALVAAAGGLAYYVGREHGRRRVLDETRAHDDDRAA